MLRGEEQEEEEEGYEEGCHCVSLSVATTFRQEEGTVLRGRLLEPRAGAEDHSCQDWQGYVPRGSLKST